MNEPSEEPVNLFELINNSKLSKAHQRNEKELKAIVNIKKFIDDHTINDLSNLRKKLIAHAQKGESEFILTQFFPLQQKWFFGKFLWNPTLLTDWKNVIKDYLTEINPTLFEMLKVENNVWLEFVTESEDEWGIDGGTVTEYVLNKYFIKVRVSKYPPKSNDKN